MGLCVRIRRHAFPSLAPGDLDWPQLQTAVKALPAAWSSIVLRSFLGGWVTHTRMQRHAFCVLGCHREPDKLSHYLLCPRLAHLASLALGPFAFPPSLSSWHEGASVCFHRCSLPLLPHCVSFSSSGRWADHDLSGARDSASCFSFA